MSVHKKSEISTLGGGCFWCLEAIFMNVRGVTDAVSGYTGGFIENPTYEDVCSGETGHAEVVQVTFNPDIISFREILDIFFSIHDPTQLNRQGYDIGTQYRSEIFYHSQSQKDIAETVLEELRESKVWKNPIVTKLSPIDTFYPAEDYHQNYYANNPSQSYCQMVISPKLASFRLKFTHLLQSD
ncbi:MAG: peptide-methionine (S)-S-oxide reductase MsrA [Promethearchaeota archaeon]